MGKQTKRAGGGLFNGTFLFPGRLKVLLSFLCPKAPDKSPGLYLKTH